jgi:diguanylate cyclase (GGDEF)-like protein
MPETNLKGALALTNRLRERVEKYLPFTISIGVTSPEKSSIPSLEELLRQADLALYQAKRSGKNKVVAFSVN